MNGAAWTLDEEIELLCALRDGKDVNALATQFNRTKNAIVTRLERLGQLHSTTGRYMRLVNKKWVVFTTWKEVKA